MRQVIHFPCVLYLVALIVSSTLPACGREIARRRFLLHFRTFVTFRPLNDGVCSFSFAICRDLQCVSRPHDVAVYAGPYWVLITFARGGRVLQNEFWVCGSWWFCDYRHTDNNSSSESFEAYVFEKYIVSLRCLASSGQQPEHMFSKCAHSYAYSKFFFYPASLTQQYFFPLSEHLTVDSTLRGISDTPEHARVRYFFGGMVADAKAFLRCLVVWNVLPIDFL